MIWAIVLVFLLALCLATTRSTAIDLRDITVADAYRTLRAMNDGTHRSVAADKGAVVLDLKQSFVLNDPNVWSNPDLEYHITWK